MTNPGTMTTRTIAAKDLTSALEGSTVTLTRPATGTVHPVPTTHTGELVSATEVTAGPRQMMRVEIITDQYAAYYLELESIVTVEQVIADHHA